MPDQTIDPYNDPLKGDFVARCSWDGCGWETKLKLNLGAGLKVGDPVYRDPENQFFGRCMRCKRHSLVITQAPEPPGPKKPKGFWKIPTE